MRHRRAHTTSVGSAARLTGLLLVCLVSLLELGLNPFGSIEADRPWSVCGQDLCLCTPPETGTAPETEPFCPLCPGYQAQQSGKDTARGGSLCEVSCDAPSSPGLARRAERLEIDLPLLSELMGATLVVRLGTPPVRIESPAFCGLMPVDASIVPETVVPSMDPPPPREA